MDLPTPTPAFRWTEEPWGAALRCDPLAELAQHLFSTRQLGLHASADPQNGKWAALGASVGLPGVLPARVRQVHGHGVRVVGLDEDATGRDGMAVWHALAAEWPEADAVVSQARGAVLAVRMADCVPMLLADARTGAVGAVHAGWRGTCTRVATAALATMAERFDTRPEDVTVAVGPSIGPCCYEVGPELPDRFEAEGHAPARVASWFTSVPGPPEAPEPSLRMDLARANRDQLEAAGVRADRIFLCGLCTRCRPDVFDSYRAVGAEAGRMAAVIRCGR